MRSHAERTLFSRRQLGAWRFAKALVGSVASPRRGRPEIRCHELARAVLVGLLGAGFSCVLRDGLAGGVDHSWLVLPASSALDQPPILDPYAPGRVPQVQLVDGHPTIARSYVAGKPRRDVDQLVVQRLLAEMGLP